jgi:carbon-monoxide dehydrogenase medium subunit
VIEISRRHGDFAIAGIVAGLALDSDGQIIRLARLVYFGVGSTPIRVKAAEDMLIGQAASEPTFEAAAESAKQNVDPNNDTHATEEYRRAVTATLTLRALRAALKKRGKN